MLRTYASRVLLLPLMLTIIPFFWCMNWLFLGPKDAVHGRAYLKLFIQDMWGGFRG